ncbi:MAG: PD40 domain-containing protein [Anaerolinea sp.]|nr:PD40 domain-containing protein [Anaerolinea sp.]
MTTPSPSPRRGWLRRTWRGPGARWLAAAALLIILALAGLLAVALAGFSSGLADRQVALETEISQRLSAGLAQRAAGQLEQAAAEFELVLQLDPNNSAAQGYLQELQANPTPQPTPSVAPLLLVPPAGTTPLPTAELLALPTDSLFERAEAALAGRDWPQAILLLNQLTALDATYQPEQVRALRFSAYVEQGRAFVNDERFEEALRSFDQALVIRPDDEELKTTRELIALYVDALGRWRLDWPGVVGNLQAIEERQPGFLDVKRRLHSAYEAWGDSLVGESDWCAAVERFDAALAGGSSDELSAKRQQAQAWCEQPPVVLGEETAQPGDETAPAAAGSGRLIFSTFDPQFSRWTIYRLPLQGERQPQTVAEGASQPVYSPDGKFIAARSERSDQTGLAVMSANGADRRRLTTFFEDAHPRWSGDGSQITFESNREGDRRWRVYTVGAAGGDDRFLDYGRWPAWSPRSGLIAYQGCGAATGRCGLLLINAGGGDSRQVTDVPGDSMPSWSPDGARIAFASAERGGSWDIFVLELASGNVATLVSSPGVDVHPVWSPDGRQVAYLSNRDGYWGIYIVDVASRQSRLALALPGALPDWYEAQLDWGR